MNSFEKTRYDNILKDMSRGLAFFDYEGNMWLISRDYAINQYEDKISYSELRKKIIEYVSEGSVNT